MHRYADYRCHKPKTLVTDLVALNPSLQDKAYLKRAGARHFMVDGRALEPCGYFTSLTQPMGSMSHWNLEVQNGLPFNAGRIYETYRDRLVKRAWRHYAFPYPAMYHGPEASLPARLRLGRAGADTYLWTNYASHKSRTVRMIAANECKASERCVEGNSYAIDTKVLAGKGKDRRMAQGPVVAAHYHATFSIQAPGDSLSRKGLLDSMVLGCIPVVFEPQSLLMYVLYACHSPLLIYTTKRGAIKRGCDRS